MLLWPPAPTGTGCFKAAFPRLQPETARERPNTIPEQEFVATGKKCLNTRHPAGVFGPGRTFENSPTFQRPFKGWGTANRSTHFVPKGTFEGDPEPLYPCGQPSARRSYSRSVRCHVMSFAALF